MGISEFQYRQLLARTKPVPHDAEYQEELPDTPERKIQDQIREHCRLKGWYCDGSVFGVSNTRRMVKGSTDLIIRTEIDDYWIEVKRAKSKPTSDQQAAMAWLKKLGANVFVVRSLDEFIEKVK